MDSRISNKLVLKYSYSSTEVYVTAGRLYVCWAHWLDTCCQNCWKVCAGIRTWSFSI